MFGTLWSTHTRAQACTPFAVYRYVSSALRSGWWSRHNFPLLIMIAEIVLNALTASALDHTTVSPHGYPIEQISLWSLGRNLITFCRVWWQRRVEHGVKIILPASETELDQDSIGSIGLNSLCAILQGQKNQLINVWLMEKLHVLILF